MTGTSACLKACRDTKLTCTRHTILKQKAWTSHDIPSIFGSDFSDAGYGA